MFYVATTFWLLVVVLSAWGVHQLWSAMIKPKVVNTVLLPGTLVAQMGHVLGLLVTGATVTNTTLYKDDDTGAPQQTENPKPRIPIIGPVIIGLLPLITCALGIFLAADWLGGTTFREMTVDRVPTALPTTLAAFWQLLRDLITLMEAVLAAATRCDLGDWRAILFLYLVVCLTVRMAPFPGNLRGSLGAIGLVGLLAVLLSLITGETQRVIERGWGVLSLSVAALLLLLLGTAAVRGVVLLLRLLFKEA